MTAAQSKKKAEKAVEKIRQLEVRLAVAVSELRAVQALCPHQNVREWNHTDYSGETDHYWNCDDCGLQRIS